MKAITNNQATILVVDDAPANINLMRSVLEGAGYQVSVATSGEKALQRAALGMPDLILLDVQLPGIDGFEVCRRLKADERTREIPVIFMTIVTRMEDKVRGFEVGGVDYITKPFQHEEVLARVTTHLRLRELTQELEQTKESLERRVVERTAELTQANARLEEEIAERQRAEKALRESEERYRSLVEIAPEAIVVHRRGRIVYGNPAAVQLYGQSPADFVGKPVMDFVHPDYRPIVIDRIRKSVEQREPAERVEEKHVRMDGQVICVEVETVPINYMDEPATLLIITDITERKRAEEELKQHRAHLEEMVEQRTAELVIAKEQAEAANQAKSAFLANMSHELRTPLNGILGYAQILKRQPLDDKVLNGLNIMQQSGEHLLTLITDILDLSKIEAGKLDLSPSDLHLPNFLQEIASLMYLRAEQEGLGFQYQPDTALPPWVQADEKRLRQVLINLLSNAVKFTDRGAVTFHVKVREPAPHSIDPQPAPTVGLRFEVIDTGVGIAADQLERIFLPFEQASNRPQYLEGAGLGLAISRQLVRAMGSDIHVSSTVGEGSTFWFDLVLPVISKGAVSPSAAEPYPIGYRGPRRKALIVDDQPDNRLILVDLLQPLGFDLREAENGQQAIESARDWQPDVILMDMFMPVLSGFEATPRLRQLPDLAATIIIGISAGVSEADTQHILQAGCHAALPKPIDVDKLLALLASQLKLEWVYTEIAQQNPAPVEVETEFVPPPPEELAILYDLARRGNLQAVQERATQLAKLDDKFGPFADKLRQLARQFEDKALVAAIQQYLEKT